MPLSKRKKGEKRDEVLPAGVVNRVQLSPYRVVLAGVQTWKVDYLPVSKEIKAVGFIEFNERGQRTVSAWIAGRIDKLFVNETGQMVDAGDKLASIYSPDLLSRCRTCSTPSGAATARTEDSARRRLELLGIDDEQIEEITANEQGQHASDDSLADQRPRDSRNTSAKGSTSTRGRRCTTWPICRRCGFRPKSTKTTWRSCRSTSSTSGKLSDATIRSMSRPRRRLFQTKPFRGKAEPSSIRTSIRIRARLRSAASSRIPATSCGPASTATVTLTSPTQEPAVARFGHVQRRRGMRRNAGRGTGAGRARKRGDRHWRANDRLSRDAARRVRGGRSRARTEDVGSGRQTVFPLLSGLKRGEEIVTAGSFLVDAETRLNPAAGSIYFGGSGGSQADHSSVTDGAAVDAARTSRAKLVAALAQPAGRRS